MCLRKYISDVQTLALLKNIIASFHSGQPRVGLPLGNLTSQLFVNIYLNKLDHFIKYMLRAKQYIRYCDDFVILSEDRQRLEGLIPKIVEFLKTELHLELHPNKVFIRTLASGIDFLGWVHFSHHRIPRTTTKHRMFKRIRVSPTRETLQSYLGLLTHGSTQKLEKKILNEYYLRQDQTVE